MPPPIPAVRHRAYRVWCGSGSAPVELEFHGDPQCPYSKKAWGVIKQLKAQYKEDEFRLVFQPFGMFAHHFAWLCIRGMSAVGIVAPDKWFDYADLLFAKQEELWATNITQDQAEAMLAGWAKSLGLDEAAFKTAFASDEATLHWKETQRVGIVRGLWSTPSFSFNGVEATKVGSSTPVDEWVSTIDGYLTSAGVTVTRDAAAAPSADTSVDAAAAPAAASGAIGGGAAAAAALMADEESAAAAAGPAATPAGVPGAVPDS